MRDEAEPGASEASGAGGASPPGASGADGPSGADGARPPGPGALGDDDGESGGDGGSTALPTRVESWRRRSATGAILTGLALGLREALETERRDPAIVLETSGEPPEDLPVEADLADSLPRRNVVSLRPWLLPADAAGSDASGSGQAAATGSVASSTPTPARRPRPRRWGRR